MKGSMQDRSFVGFGFGPIQTGLFLLEAARSGKFSRFIVAEIDPTLVADVNASGGAYTLNIAHPDRIEKCVVENVRMLNPRVPADRQELIAAIRSADELATALPSVKFYAGDEASVVSLLSVALSDKQGKLQVLYAAENDNHAAEILTQHLQSRVTAERLVSFQVLNTVIGKMSGVITDPDEIARLGLTPMTPCGGKAILVESFNRILISQIALSGFRRGIGVFSEKHDLMPFEEAKLYGHNAIHALIGYLAHERGLTTMAQVAKHQDILSVARAAFLDESGAALVRKYACTHDPLFTPGGYAAYADDLLSRMVNPNLNDLVIRVIRDPQRKLAWTDRLYGTMRLALDQGTRPINMALGAAAAVRYMLGQAPPDRDALGIELRRLWNSPADPQAQQLIDLTWDAMQPSGLM